MRFAMKMASSMSCVTNIDRLPLGLPDRQQELLHQRARLTVERAERLRPKAGSSGRSPTLLQSPCAAACRRTAFSDSDARTRQSPTFRDIVRGDFGLLRDRHPFFAQAEADVLPTVSHGNNV
jgi:hypothetical protein